jgi:hypothetical protein
MIAKIFDALDKREHLVRVNAVPSYMSEGDKWPQITIESFESTAILATSLHDCGTVNQPVGNARDAARRMI